jgi:hypothetical protein
VSKRLGSAYRSGRSRQWIKVKNPRHRQCGVRRKKSGVQVGCFEPWSAAPRYVDKSDPRVTRQEATGASVSLSKLLLNTFHQLRLSYLARRQLYDLAALTKPEN